MADLNGTEHIPIIDAFTTHAIQPGWTVRPPHAKRDFTITEPIRAEVDGSELAVTVHHLGGVWNARYGGDTPCPPFLRFPVVLTGTPTERAVKVTLEVELVCEAGADEYVKDAVIAEQFVRTVVGRGEASVRDSEGFQRWIPTGANVERVEHF